jgi:hypothetical protein
VGTGPVHVHSLKGRLALHFIYNCKLDEFCQKYKFFAKPKLRAIVRTINLHFSFSLNERKRQQKYFPRRELNPGLLGESQYPNR